MKTVYLLDTNIISEFVKPKPDSSVLMRFDCNKRLCAISAITWQELIYGFNRMPEGKRKASIENFLYNLKQNTQIIPYDSFAAQICGELQADFGQHGITLPYHDSQIAATAISNGMILVTHNTADFQEIHDRAFLHLEDWFKPE